MPLQSTRCRNLVTPRCTSSKPFFRLWSAPSTIIRVRPRRRGGMLGEDRARLSEAVLMLHEINLGATAIGTQLNAPEGYVKLACEHLGSLTGIELVTAVDLIEATQDCGAFVQLSGTLKRVAVKLSKICNDLRLLSSGPRAGFNEINLPQLQPGSSIMVLLAQHRDRIAFGLAVELREHRPDPFDALDQPARRHRGCAVEHELERGEVGPAQRGMVEQHVDHDHCARAGARRRKARDKARRHAGHSGERRTACAAAIASRKARRAAGFDRAAPVT